MDLRPGKWRGKSSFSSKFLEIILKKYLIFKLHDKKFLFYIFLFFRSKFKPIWNIMPLYNQGEMTKKILHPVTIKCSTISLNYVWAECINWNSVRVEGVYTKTVCKVKEECSFLYISVYIWQCVFCVMLNKLSARTEPKPFEFFLCSCMFFYRRRQGQREAGGGNKPLKCKVQK